MHLGFPSIKFCIHLFYCKCVPFTPFSHFYFHESSTTLSLEAMAATTDDLISKYLDILSKWYGHPFFVEGKPSCSKCNCAVWDATWTPHPCVIACAIANKKLLPALKWRGHDNVVGVATQYRLDCLGFKPWWG